MKTEHLLIIRLSAIGDVAMLVPVVASLARQHPQMRITVLSRPFARWIFEDLAPNVGFMAADTNGEDKGIRGLNALYRRLQAKHFTAVADMHDVLRTKYLRLRFLMDRYRVEHIDKHRKEKKLLVRKGFKASHQLPTSFDNYARLRLPACTQWNTSATAAIGDRRKESVSEMDRNSSLCCTSGQDISA